MRILDISVNQLLKKIESELHRAKQEENALKRRESIHSIKILCELILEENDKSLAVAKPLQPTSQVITTTSLSPKKLEMKEEANGDSLFDF
jgi:hypothetical protein